MKTKVVQIAVSYGQDVDVLFLLYENGAVMQGHFSTSKREWVWTQIEVLS